tara:strand:- start:19 stop:318 length:300 start_codon:yes stop_codon:yes gene_type:complete
MTSDDESIAGEYGVLIHSIEKRKTEQVRISLSEYSGNEYIDIRSFYLDRGSSEFKPTRRGVTLPTSAFPELLQGVIELGNTLGVIDTPVSLPEKNLAEE